MLQLPRASAVDWLEAAMRDLRCFRAVLVLATTGALCGWPHALLATSSGAGQAPDLMSAQTLRGDPGRGRTAFNRCVVCHRNDGGGRPKLGTPRLSGQHASVIIKQVADIRSGQRLNPPMKDMASDPALTAQTLADMASHLQGLPFPSDVELGPGTAVERGRQLFARDCTGCHGTAGEGRADRFQPMVAAQHHSYLLRELQLIRDGKRGNSDPDMVKLIKTYAPSDLEALADAIARMPPPPR